MSATMAGYAHLAYTMTPGGIVNFFLLSGRATTIAACTFVQQNPHTEACLSPTCRMQAGC
jgi:hypothetical protein